MIKKYLPMLIITTILLLIPMIVGIVLWDKLPDELPMHWNTKGEIDNYASKTFTVFGFTAMMIVFQIVCFLAILADPKKQNVDGKPMTFVLWIIPLVTAVCYFSVYSSALGYEVSTEKLVPFIMGIIFAIVGNYLPKCKQNYTVGIKIPWTLESEENWNKTHRFAGVIWTVGGILIALTSFLGSYWISIAFVSVMAFAPVIYSFLYYRKTR